MLIHRDAHTHDPLTNAWARVEPAAALAAFEPADPVCSMQAAAHGSDVGAGGGGSPNQLRSWGEDKAGGESELNRGDQISGDDDDLETPLLADEAQGSAGAAAEGQKSSEAGPGARGGKVGVACLHVCVCVSMYMCVCLLCACMLACVCMHVCMYMCMC